MRNARDKLRLSNKVTQECLPMSDIETLSQVVSNSQYVWQDNAASTSLVLALSWIRLIVARQLSSTFHVTKWIEGQSNRCEDCKHMLQSKWVSYLNALNSAPYAASHLFTNAILIS